MTRAVPSYVREDQRGRFVEIVNSGPWETVVTGVMRPGALLGRHYHRRTRVFFYLVDGAAEIEVVDVPGGTRQRTRLTEAHGIYLEPHQAHQIRFEAESSFIMLKSRRYAEADPDTYPYDFESGA